jgi:hypothetical protein
MSAPRVFYNFADPTERRRMAAAVAELKTALDVVETNAPINAREGNKPQAQLERKNAQSFRAAITKLTGQHCHDNGVCHDHPNDGKDYG